MSQWQPCDPEFNLTHHLIPFLQNNAFYCEISRHIQKFQTHDIPTAAVTFDEKLDEFVLWINPDFVKQQTDTQIRGLIRHEYDHIVFGHLTSRRQDPADDWNVATDLAINSLIDKHMERPADANGDELVLPKCALIPGKRPWVDPIEFAKLTLEQQLATTELCDMIEAFPPGKASEWYFERLKKVEPPSSGGGEGGGGAQDGDQPTDGKTPGSGSGAKKKGGSGSQSKKKKGASQGSKGTGVKSMDEHSDWDSVPDDMREYIQGKARAIVQKAVRTADETANGWGSIPAFLQDEIRQSVDTSVDWRSLLRHFFGTLVRGDRTSSMKRINRRYPYVHPGAKRGRVAKLLIAIDESGSVGQDLCDRFFSEIGALAKRVDITILHFDCSCTNADLYEWRKGTRPEIKRKRTGGTDFDAPTRLANDPKNRGRFDALVVLTDGCAAQPEPSRIKRGWVLGPGCKLIFPSDELQVVMDETHRNTGAWR